MNMANLERISPNVATRPHRELLANHERNVDSTSDKEGTTDDEDELVDLVQHNGEIGNLLGFSISQAQTHMKSPRTPAYEKAQALEESRGYFDPDVTRIGDAEDSPPLVSNKVVQAVRNGLPQTQPSPDESQSESRRRSSITRNILGNIHAGGRRRSSSGPTAVIGSLKKILTDLPSYPGFGSSSVSDHKEELDASAIQQRQPEVKNRSKRSSSVTQPALYRSLDHGLDRATPSSEQGPVRPKPLRRVTSDQSLYLRKVTTGAVDFDDTAAFSKVADMPNPRFKAITDSLADSSIRMPKMPSMNFNPSRKLTLKNDNETLKRNTALSSRLYDSLESRDGTDFSSSGYNSATSSSNKKHPLLAEALSRATGDLIFMGGYRGSVLRSAEPPYQQLWVPVKVGLGFRKVDLELGLTREDEERASEKIIPSGILSHIGPIDIARRLMKKVGKCPNARANLLRIHDWGYDWRLSPHLLSQRLIKFLENLECNRPGTPKERRGALVVAHSLGGLITRHAVNQRPELFSGVIYAGTPSNCCNILGPLRNGDDVLLTSKVLTAQVNFTLRTSYALLPEDGRCFINKQTGERYDVDFFDINTWDEYRLSPCISTPLPPFVQQPRKTFVGSISESISSFTPSLPNKRSSWFSSLCQPENQSNSSNSDKLEAKATGARENIESTAQSVVDGIQSPVQQVQDSLEPSMKPSHNKSSIATTVTIPKDKAREYLIRTLAEVKQFKAELAHIPAHQEANRYPPHAVIFGKSVPTVYGAKVASREAIKCADAFDDIAFAAGDGVVLASASQLPDGFRCVKNGRVQSDRGHIGLLGDLEGVGQCISAVIDGRRRGVGFGDVHG